MNALKDFLYADTPCASALSLGGLYVMSLGAVFGMIEGTQWLLGLI